MRSLISPSVTARTPARAAHAAGRARVDAELVHAVPDGRTLVEEQAVADEEDRLAVGGESERRVERDQPPFLVIDLDFGPLDRDGAPGAPHTERRHRDDGVECSRELIEAAPRVSADPVDATAPVLPRQRDGLGARLDRDSLLRLELRRELV